MATTSPPTMTVEQARQVAWLRNNPRPLGELLDEGYLNEGRLAWAAEKAYNADLKAAATVLLAHVRSARWQLPQRAPASPAQSGQPLELTLTEAEARATPWPFPPHKGDPMGNLSDTRRLSLKDLGYAIDNAWDRRVRDAAILLMAQRLRQAVAEPADDAGVANVVSAGRSYSQRQELVWVMVFGSFLTALAIGVSVALFFSIRSSIHSVTTPVPEVLRHPTTEVVIALVIVIGAMLVLDKLVIEAVKWMMDRIEQQIMAHRRGQEGEERVLEAVRRNLNGAWTVFRNLKLPARKAGDLDLVLVGPSGVWVLEVKNFSGTYRNYGEHWDYRAGKHWKAMKKRGPTRQAQSNAAQLAAFLKADGLRQYVEPAVVWANAETVPEIDQPLVPVWTLDRLPDELGNLDRGRRMDPAQQTQIVDKLTALCARQAQAHDNTEG